MERTLKKAVVNISKEAAFILVTVIGAVVLPQILHGAGVLLGVGGRLGQIFLPMYLPVLILGFYRVPAAGAVAGLLVPMASFAVTEMIVACKYEAMSCEKGCDIVVSFNVVDHSVRKLDDSAYITVRHEKLCKDGVFSVA